MDQGCLQPRLLEGHLGLDQLSPCRQVLLIAVQKKLLKRSPTLFEWRSHPGHPANLRICNLQGTSNYMKFGIRCTLEGWELITSFPTFTIPRNYCRVWSSSTFGGFDIAELPSRWVRPKFRPFGRKAKSGASLLVCHLCTLFPIDLDVVFSVGSFFLYQAPWGGKRNGK